jgi:NtrC-family two-component system response regulator AlgB
MLAFGVTADGDESSSASSSRGLLGLGDLLEHDVAIIDWEMRDEPPEQLVAALQSAAPALPVIAMVGSPTALSAAEQTGLVEVLMKPVDVDALRQRLQRFSRTSVKRDGGASGEEIRFVTHSATMEQVLSVAWRVAPTIASVLILGENGTGKSMLARAMHSRSSRRHKPFVSVNCPCLQPQLLESELFGHVRGAFTGAVSDTAGKVAAAEGGTLFLDEVGELPLEVQSKLLRLLQERCYERVGESRTHTADIRVLAATNRDLRQQVMAGLFREDLFYRLNVITIEMPPLRSRPEDILPSAEFFLGDISRSTHTRPRSLSVSAREALLAHAWPGNLRELRNVIERAAILCDHAIIEAPDFPELTQRAESSLDPKIGEFVTIDAVVEAHIRRVTARAESYEQAARILGIDKSTLYRWRKRVEHFQPAEESEALVG